MPLRLIAVVFMFSAALPGTLQAGVLDFVKDKAIEKAESLSYCMEIKDFRGPSEGNTSEVLTLQVRLSRDVPYSVAVDNKTLYSKAEGSLKETYNSYGYGKNVEDRISAGGPRRITIKLDNAANKFGLTVVWNGNFSVIPCANHQ